MTPNRDKLAPVAAGYSQAGLQRAVNEDHLATPEAMDPELLARQGHLYVVADGMGGHAAGAQASALAVKTVMEAYYGHPSPDSAQALTDAIRQANDALYRQAQYPETAGMGSTVVAALILGHDLYIAHVGDSRAYLIRGQTIRQITRDHSWVAEQVEAGLLSEEEARRHPHRNVVTRALGSEPQVEIDLSRETVRPGDAVLLCSDGLTDQVSDEEIRQIVADHDPPEAASQLVELANQRGGSDDVTALVIGIRRASRLAIAALLRSSRFAPIAGGVAIAVVVLIAVYLALPLIESLMPVAIPLPSPTATGMVSTSTPVPSVPAATPAVTPSPSVPTPTLTVPVELATATLEPSPTMSPTPTSTPEATSLPPRPQVFDTKAPKGAIRYVVKEGDWLMLILRKFGRGSVEARQEADEICRQYPQILWNPRNCNSLRPGSLITLKPLNFGYLVGGRVENFSFEKREEGFDLALDYSDPSEKWYKVRFLDPESVRRQPFPLINGEIVRVFGYLKEENLLEVALVDRYLQEEERWQNWYFATAEEDKRLWVYGKLNEWSLGGVEGVRHFMESNHGEAVAAYGFWQRSSETPDIIAFQTEQEVYFWNETEGVYAR